MNLTPRNQDAETTVYRVACVVAVLFVSVIMLWPIIEGAYRHAIR